MTEKPWRPPFEAKAEEVAFTLAEEEAGRPPVPFVTEARSRRSTAARWFGTLLLLFVLGAATVETMLFLLAWIDTNPFVGGLLGALFAAAVASGLVWALRELRELRRLRAVGRLRAAAERLLAGESRGEASPFLAEVSRAYRGRSEAEPATEAFAASVSDAHSDREILELYVRTVMEPLDRQAYRAILSAARDTAVLTAVSPAALLDAVLVSWRNLKLIRVIAEAYGFRPGWYGSMRLGGAVLRTLTFAGAAEILSDATAETLGGSLAAMASTRAGQGIANGLLTARLGLIAMQLCRPIPFLESDRPSFRKLRAEIAAAVKGRG